MANILVDDVVRAVLTWDGLDGVVYNTILNYIMTTGAGIDPSDATTAIQTNFITAFLEIRSHINSAVVGSQWELFKYDFVNHRWDGIDLLAATGIAGIGVGATGPQGIAMLGRLITQLARRQGRVYISGLLENAVDVDSLTSAAEADLADFLLAFHDPITPSGGTLEMCTFNVDPGSPLYETASIDSGVAIANTLVGYQRRRKPGVGI